MKAERPVPAAFATGLALGAAAAAGVALLLYQDQGLIRSLGLLSGLAILSAAGGVWTGTSAAAGSIQRRGLIAVGAQVGASVFALFWTSMAGLQQSALGMPLAVVLLLAGPVYAAAALLGALGGARVAVVGLGGAATGVVLATAALIPHLPAGSLYLGAATFTAAGLLWAGHRSDEGDDMDAKRVIVTGVGREGQVGYAVAKAFLDAGARVVITDRKDTVTELAGRLAADGRCIGVAADLGAEAGAASVVETARRELGGLDILVNAVGGLTVIKPVGETTPEEWRAEVERNARTAFLMCRAALPLLRESKGAIVNFASPAGQRAVKRMAAYSAGKAGVIALTRSLALEEKGTVRVNAVAPGMVDTAQNRKSVDDPASTDFVAMAEIVNVVLFLADDAAAGVTGETVKVLGTTLS